MNTELNDVFFIAQGKRGVDLTQFALDFHARYAPDKLLDGHSDFDVLEALSKSLAQAVITYATALIDGRDAASSADYRDEVDWLEKNVRIALRVAVKAVRDHEIEETGSGQF